MKSKIIRDRARLLAATRDLLYVDASLMEDYDGCEYCKGAYGTGTGHSSTCHFANAVDVLLQKRATTLDGIKEEVRLIYEVLVNLASDDYLMLDETVPCTHCDSDEHTAECSLHNALTTIIAIKKERLIQL